MLYHLSYVNYNFCSNKRLNADLIKNTEKGFPLALLMAVFPRFLWIICVLLYWRKVNREAEITLQPCLFQLIWTARLHTVTLTPLQLFLPRLCVLAAPRLSSVGSQGATLTPSFSCLTFRRADERRAWTHRDLFKERHCSVCMLPTCLLPHPLWLRIFPCTVLTAVDLLLWAQCGQRRLHSLLGKTGANFTPEFYCMNYNPHLWSAKPHYNQILSKTDH